MVRRSVRYAEAVAITDSFGRQWLIREDGLEVWCTTCRRSMSLPEDMTTFGLRRVAGGHVC